MYAIRNYDNETPTGYYIDQHGPLLFSSKREAKAEAARLNSYPHAPGREYRAEPIED